MADDTNSAASTDAPSVEAADAPPIAEASAGPSGTRHPLEDALNQHFPDEPGHPDDSLYARARRMFQAIVENVR